MKKILIPTDFSKASNKAIDYAIMLAKKQQTPIDLKLLNSYFIREELALIISEQHIKKLSRHELFDITLSKHFQDLPKHISTSSSIKRGPVVPSIIQEAEVKDTDLIIMGRNGAGGLKDWLLGSTTEQVIKRCNKPVIITPLKTSVSPPLRIALAIDNHHVPSEKTLQPLFELVDTFNAELLLFHVIGKPEKETIHRQTAINIARKGYMVNLHRTHANHIGDGLLQLSQKHHIDLLCIIRHNHNQWKNLVHLSTTADIANNNLVPFMVLHDNH